MAPLDSAEDQPQPPIQDLESRYGPLFARALSDRWDDCGREIDYEYGMEPEDDDEGDDEEEGAGADETMEE